MTFTLPFPPLLNRYYHYISGGRVLTKEARAYKLAALVYGKRQRVRLLEGPLFLSVIFFRKAKRGDIDGPLKALLDAMQGVAYRNDSQVKELHVLNLEDRTPHVSVTVRKYGEADEKRVEARAEGGVRIPTGSRVCPKCGGPKAYYARSCRPCAPKPMGLLGRKGPAHPAWKGGREIDRDGYVRTYAPAHPWPRANGCVLEHVRVMELHLGRRIRPGEVVHHRDHNRQNNALSNLELLRHSEHSRRHRAEDVHRRRRDRAGRFA